MGSRFKVRGSRLLVVRGSRLEAYGGLRLEAYGDLRLLQFKAQGFVSSRLEASSVQGSRPCRQVTLTKSTSDDKGSWLA